MTAGRIGRACGCIVVTSMLWCTSAQAQSDAAAGPTSAPAEINAVAIEMHRAGEHVAFPGAAMSWTAATPAQMDFDILAGPLELGRGAIKDAPYAAEAINEVVQTLADGNRIVRSSTTAIYRDAAGRTRREQGLAMIGPLVATADQAKQVIITDPEKGITYVLDPTARTARRMPMPSFGAALGRSAAGVPLPPPPVPLPPPPGAGDVVFYGASFEAAAPPSAVAEMRTMVTAQRFGGAPAGASESLGTQTVEGVLAEGTRSTVTIAAGQIGNERPIEIVSERWFSPQLKALVLSKQSDPRFGETNYRLSNIVLGDPDPSFFEVPPDFQIVETGGAGDMIFRRRAP